MQSFLKFLFTPLPEDDAYIELSIGGVHRNHRHWYDVLDPKYPGYQLPANSFVGPTIRAKPGILGKANCLASSVVWIDWDEETRPVPVLPPSCVVWSGHGYHFYWKLDKWYTDLDGLEDVMIKLEKSMGADPCHNIDRIMRLPGTVNAKDEDKPVSVKIIESHPGRTYTLQDVLASARMGPKIVRKIINGNMQGFKSRSDRDWSIVRLLLQAGMSDGGVEAIFQYHKCGDKYRDPKTDGPKYLAHTIEKARASTGAVAIILDEDGIGKSGLREGEDGYYATTTKGSKRVSTFTVTPRLLLEGVHEDFILCDVMAAGTSHTWRGEVLPISALNARHSFKRWCTKASWVWLGRDADVEALQIHLITTLQAMGMPHTYATHVLGMQKIPNGDEYYYVSNNAVMDSSGKVWHGDDVSPIMYVDKRQEAPRITLNDVEVDNALLSNLCDLLPLLNDSDVIWPLIGWFMATPLKPVFESLGYRFPICNVFGTRGSGKTTTILQVFHKLLGYTDKQNYDAKTTRFVTLVLLGSTYSVPIAFSEFRVASVGDFARYILLSYDTGNDPRGHANQTTTGYPLTAPFTIDGEDMVEDSASLERIIAIRMFPASIREGTAAHNAFDEIGGLDLQNFMVPYLRYVMQCDVPMLLDIVEQEMFEAFPAVLPNRIRRNLTIVWAGIHLFSSFMQQNKLFCTPMAGASILETVLHNVYSLKLGRASTAADEFIELIVNAAARKVRSFPYHVEDDVLWFQLAPAFEYYTSQRTSQRRDTLGKGAIATQLYELIAEYMLEPTVKVIKQKKVLAYGVDLKRASNAGLDLPRQIIQGEITLVLED